MNIDIIMNIRKTYQIFDKHFSAEKMRLSCCGQQIESDAHDHSNFGSQTEVVGESFILDDQDKTYSSIHFITY